MSFHLFVTIGFVHFFHRQKTFSIRGLVAFPVPTLLYLAAQAFFATCLEREPTQTPKILLSVSRDELYKNRSSRKMDSQILFSREYDFSKTVSLTEKQFCGKTHFYTIHPCALESASAISCAYVFLGASAAAAATVTFWSQLYKNRSSRKIDSPRLFSRE